MKKKLDEAAIANELREGSLHFRRPEEETPAEPDEETPEATNQQHEPVTPAPQAQPLAPASRPLEAVDERTAVRTAVRVPRRTLKRHPFEFYKDQLDQLKQIALTEELAGGRGNMSEMVRAAIDEWLAKRATADNGTESRAG